jgi:hypothetical protein
MHPTTCSEDVVFSPSPFYCCEFSDGLIAGIGTYLIMEGTFYLLALVGVSKPVYDDMLVSSTEGDKPPKDGDGSDDDDPKEKPIDGEEYAAGEAQEEELEVEV